MAGAIIGSFGLMQVIFRLPFGIWADRMRFHKLFIFIGIASAIISSLIFFFSDNIYFTLLARACVGITASAWVNITVLFSRCFRREETVKAMGLLNFFICFGQILGMVAGALLIGWVGGEYGLRAGYNSAFILSFVAAVLCLIPAAIIRETRESRGDFTPVSARKIKSVISDKRLLSVSAISIVMQFITFGLTFGFLTEYAHNVLHTTPVQNGVLTVVPYIPTALGALIISKISVGRTREPALVFLGMMLMSVFTIITPFIPNFWMLVSVQTIVGIGRGISFPLLMGLAIKHIAPEYHGTAMGTFQASYAIGIFVGPLFSGVIGDIFSLQYAFFLCGALCMAMAAIGYYLIKWTDANRFRNAI